MTEAKLMPEVSRFYGMVIAMYHSEHPPPHFHVRYAGKWAVFSIDNCELLEGTLPRRQMRHIKVCARLHGAELAVNWDRPRVELNLNSIEPLP